MNFATGLLAAVLLLFAAFTLGCEHYYGHSYGYRGYDRYGYGGYSHHGFGGYYHGYHGRRHHSPHYYRYHHHW